METSVAGARVWGRGAGTDPSKGVHWKGKESHVEQPKASPSRVRLDVKRTRGDGRATRRQRLVGKHLCRRLLREGLRRWGEGGGCERAPGISRLKHSSRFHRDARCKATSAASSASLSPHHREWPSSSPTCAARRSGPFFAPCGSFLPFARVFI